MATVIQTTFSFTLLHPGSLDPWMLAHSHTLYHWNLPLHDLENVMLLDTMKWSPCDMAWRKWSFFIHWVMMIMYLDCAMMQRWDKWQFGNVQNWWQSFFKLPWMCCCWLIVCVCSWSEVVLWSASVDRMVCAECEKKQKKVITPDTWKAGARNTTEFVIQPYHHHVCVSSFIMSFFVVVVVVGFFFCVS